MPSAAGNARRRRWAAGIACTLLIATVLAPSRAVPRAAVRAQSPGGPAMTSAAPTVAGAAPGSPRAPSVDEAEVQAVARGLNCPICQGRNLVECPLPVCAEMRDDIRARLAAGADRAQIIDHFVAYYGPEVRNTPPFSGPQSLAWWVPVGLLFGGAWLVVRLVRPGGGIAGSTDTHRVADDAAAKRDDAAYAAKLERLVADRDRGDAT